MNKWNKPALLFLTSQAITLFGSTLVQMAIIWYVTLKTGEGAWVAAFSVASYLPQFLISFLGGVWADRYSKKLLIIVSDGAIALITLIMWLLMPYIGSDSLTLSLLLIMSALRSLGAGIQIPAVNAILPLLVPEDSLMRYNGINSTMQSVVQFAAPAAAGAVLSFSHLSSVLLIDVATAAIGIGMFAFIVLPKNKPQVGLSLIADMKLGIKYALNHKFLKRLFIIYGLFIFLVVPSGFLAQLFVSRTFGNTYWYLTAVEVSGFLGMIVGGLVMSTWGGLKSRNHTLALGLAAFGITAIAMGFSKQFILYLSIMFICGIPLTMVQTTVTTIIQEKSESTMQGRMFGLMGTMYSGFLPLGMAIFGPLSDVLSLAYIMIATGMILVALSFFAKNIKE